MTESEPSSERSGIAAVGGYVPRLALPAEAYREAWETGAAPGVDRTAVPDADEDSLTLAAEAGRRALDAAAVDPSEIASLAFATTTPPSEEDEAVVRLASLLGTPASARTREHGRSTRAGVAALADALAGDVPTPALVVAADCPNGSPESDTEAAAGAGAGAALIVDGGPLRAIATGEHADPYPGTRFRRHGRTQTESLGAAAYERDAYRTCVASAIADGLPGDSEPTEADPDAVALTAPDGKLPYRVAGGAPGLDVERIAAGTVVDRTGDTGVAGPLLGLADALADGARRPLIVGYGGGSGATAVHLSRDGTVSVDAAIDPVTDLTYAAYARRRGFVTGDAPAGGGANVSVPSWRRTLPQRHRLVAGRCSDCSALRFPPEGACVSCGSLAGYDSVQLPGTGTVEAVTTVGAAGAPPEFAVFGQRAGSFGVAVVGFDAPETGSVSLPVSVIADVDVPAVGDRVRTVPRRIYEREGVVRYGLKVVPTDAIRESHSR
ncbi:zinc ribbon domain-containing protein [Halorubrum sp. DTA46]|uniref:zinc ribbon domain-containing protein n=1 Tax=Halorubrum sp. DTA46 TaxID=3402162 RepID=UPI003AACABBB